MVRKHDYGSRPAPERPDQFAEELFALAWAGHVGEERGRKLMRLYAQAFAKQDRGAVGAQVRDQLGPLARFRPGLSAVEALYQPDAAGARAYKGGEFTAGEFFHAAWHRRGGSERRARLESVRNSFSTEVPDAGGFLLPEDVRSDLVFASLSLGFIRRLARVFPTTTQRTALPVADETSRASSVLGGWSMAFTEEGQAISESTASFGRVFLDSKKLAAYGVTPNELVSDAPAWDAFIRAAIPEALAYHEDLYYLTGSGTGEPMGMVSCAGSISVAKETGQASSTIVYPNVVNMAARLLPTSWPRAIWVAASDAFTELAQLALPVGTGGSAVFTTENGLTIFGRPVYFSDFMPKLGSTGDLVLLDPAYYAIADRATLQVASSPHLKFGNDLTTWRITSRQDARPLLNSSITPRNGASNSLGAYIQIAAR